MDTVTSPNLRLRDLPLASRLVIAAFLISTGIGYFSALVQMHFQHAASGSLLPGRQEAIDVYHGTPNTSELERLLKADESQPFNGFGTMRPAFTSKSAGWPRTLRNRSKAKGLNLLDAERELRRERDGERLALLDWLERGASKDDYDNDAHKLEGSLADVPVTEEYLIKGKDDKPVTPRQVKIQTILSDRCVRCHSVTKTGVPAQFPLDTYDDIQIYCERAVSGGMSLTRLAQTTHVHLLGFGMLFGLTGLAFSFTSYPGWIRAFFGPFTLVAQVIDIGCWWASRSDQHFAEWMLVTGGLVALGLLIQIVGTLFNLFGRSGKLAILILLLGAAGGGIALKRGVIDPYLERETVSPEIRDSQNPVQLRHR
jgi:hypothetical protein